MYGSHKKHSAGARNVKARAKRALLLPSMIIKCGLFSLAQCWLCWPKVAGNLAFFE